VTLTNNTFSMAEAKKTVEDLFEPSALIYWFDFLFNTIVGWAAFAATLTFPNFSVYQELSILVSVFCLYRAVIFIHELTHLKKDTFMGFRLVWNVLCGFPFMVPSFTYMGVHIDHHKQRFYGTKDDGEYLPFVLLGRFRIVLFFIVMLFAPLAFLVRFLLTPLTYVIPPLRKLTWGRLSSLSIDPDWKRPEPQERDGKHWQLQEWMTFFYADTFIALLVLGILPLKVFVLWYVVAALILEVNGLRTIAATHCYRNPSDRILEFSEQILDSVTVPGNPITTTLWAPVGLRYHAAHHLFPGMPYHHLAEAHRRLMKTLPENSIYRLTLRKSLWHGLVTIWNETEKSRKKKN